jgi:hypothetical protein
VVISSIVINLRIFGSLPNTRKACLILIFNNKFSISPPKFSKYFLFFSIKFSICSICKLSSRFHLIWFTLYLKIFANSLLSYFSIEYLNGNLRFNPSFWAKKHLSISLAYPAIIQINLSPFSDKFWFNVSIASFANESPFSLLLPEPNEYTSSINNTPPIDSSITFWVFNAVEPTYCPIKSLLLTTLNLNSSVFIFSFLRERFHSRKTKTFLKKKIEKH